MGEGDSGQKLEVVGYNLVGDTQGTEVDDLGLRHPQKGQNGEQALLVVDRSLDAL